jgi:protein tyrosine/serine phosphatase
MATERHLDWDGCWNARDLGGLRTVAGPPVGRGALVRSESPHRLTAEGWAAARAFGIRTLVDLRDLDEVTAEPPSPPPGITTVRVPIEQGLRDDPEFRSWAASGRLAGPHFYARFVERWPDRCARAVAAVADAPPGGVLVHCARGRDRTGLVVLLVLALVGVAPDDIVADFVLSDDRVRSARARALGWDDDTALLEAVLRQEGITVRDGLLGLLRSVDVGAALRAGGLTDGQVGRLRRRLLT